MLRELADSTNLRCGRAEYMGEIMAVDKTVLELVQNPGCAVEAKHAHSEVCTYKAQREPRTLRPRHCISVQFHTFYGPECQLLVLNTTARRYARVCRAEPIQHFFPGIGKAEPAAKERTLN